METPQEIIESLTFYGTGDEAYELFQITCALSHKMWGLSETAKSLILAEWAQEQAEESFNSYFDFYDGMSPIDSIDGYWG